MVDIYTRNTDGLFTTDVSKLILEFLGKIPEPQIWDYLGWFSVFIFEMVYCVYSLESPE